MAIKTQKFCQPFSGEKIGEDVKLYFLIVQMAGRQMVTMGCIFRSITIREKSLVSKTPRSPSEGMKIVFCKVQPHQSTGFTGFALKMSFEFVVRFAQHNCQQD